LWSSASYILSWVVGSDLSDFFLQSKSMVSSQGNLPRDMVCSC
jgi:hypothetical protein